jgi:hypothetical protein
MEISEIDTIYSNLKFVKPYNNGHYVLNKRKEGVYFIKENNQLVYIGSSKKNSTSALYRHFQQWNDRRFQRITYNRDVCTVIIFECEKSFDIEVKFIQYFKPRDNKNLYIEDLEMIDSIPPIEWGEKPKIIPF